MKSKFRKRFTKESLIGATRISRVKFAHKGLKAGEGFVSNEVCFGQRKHRSNNRERSRLAQHSFTRESNKWLQQTDDFTTVLHCFSLLNITLFKKKIQEKQNVDTELLKLREALKEAEGKARTREEERDKALQHLQTSTEVNLKI